MTTIQGITSITGITTWKDGSQTLQISNVRPKFPYSMGKNSNNSFDFTLTDSNNSAIVSYTISSTIGTVDTISPSSPITGTASGSHITFVWHAGSSTGTGELVIDYNDGVNFNTFRGGLTVTAR